MSRRLFASGWLLLVIFSDMGIVKHGGDYENKAECLEGWEGIVRWLKCKVDKQKGSKYPMDWGQAMGFCVEAERLIAPGVIFKPKEKEDPDGCNGQ